MGKYAEKRKRNVPPEEGGSGVGKRDKRGQFRGCDLLSVAATTQMSVLPFLSVVCKFSIPSH